jgi:antitoxin CptB
MTTDDTRRRRALYRAQHRGTKEMDFLLGRYAEARLAAMTPGDLAAFEELLALPDPELQGWLMHGRPFEGSGLADLLRDIQAFHGMGARTQ